MLVGRRPKLERECSRRGRLLGGDRNRGGDVLLSRLFCDDARICGKRGGGFGGDLFLGVLPASSWSRRIRDATVPTVMGRWREGRSLLGKDDFGAAESACVLRAAAGRQV